MIKLSGNEWRGGISLHDLPDLPDQAADLLAPPRFDAIDDPVLYPQDELAAGAGALLWAIAAAVVCVVTVIAVWVTG